ncbi:MAG: antitoxin [Candidatus Marinimicrobia bacterium]|nr:antitoxin [Candidatus Neomarinimicrobiota bacterium]MCK4447025.1 antitoxin [Candidatus Neomarinimicrobiota bacterium]
MQTKLTLRLEDDLILKAKTVANKKGTSLSKLVADFFTYITKRELDENINLPPNVKSLYGALTDSNINDTDYKKYLEGKYL